MNEIERLNQVFGQEDQIKISTNAEGIALVELSNDYGKVLVSTYGGQVLSFQPHDSEQDILFLSEKAVFEPGKAIRGGCPICWPWFGNDKTGYGRPSHGFARNQQWRLSDTFVRDGSVSIRLELNADEGSLAVWPYHFQLSLLVTLGTELELALTTRNTGNKAFTMSQAIHSYFKVGDISNISITGLDNKNYLDKLDAFSQKQQQGDLAIREETDRIYQQVENDVVLHDPDLGRDIVISSSGSATTVIWNPWQQAISGISDLQNSDYQHFICIETANAAEDEVTLEEGEQHTINATYRLA